MSISSPEFTTNTEFL